jgi:hypothetical protein
MASSMITSPTLSKCFLIIDTVFQFLPWLQNKNIRFGLEGLYLLLIILFYTKTFHLRRLFTQLNSVCQNILFHFR